MQNQNKGIWRARERGIKGREGCNEQRKKNHGKDKQMLMTVLFLKNIFLFVIFFPCSLISKRFWLRVPFSLFVLTLPHCHTVSHFIFRVKTTITKEIENNWLNKHKRRNGAHKKENNKKKRRRKSTAHAHRVGKIQKDAEIEPCPRACFRN